MALQSGTFAIAITLMAIRKCCTFAVTPSLPDLRTAWLIKETISKIFVVHSQQSTKLHYYLVHC